jgi:uncharacterized protein (TIRG00374 family)
MRQPEKKRGSWLRFVIGLIISSAALYFLFHDLDISSLNTVLKTARIEFLLLGLLSVLLNNFFKGARWFLLNRVSPKPPGLSEVLSQFVLGQAINMLIPGRLGDLGRIQNLGLSAGSRSYVAGTIGVEKLLDLIAYALLFGLLFLLIPAPDWIASPGFSMLGIAILLIVLLALLARSWRKLILLWLRWAERLPTALEKLALRSRRTLDSLDVLQESRYLFWIIMLTAFIWGTAILNNYLVLQAIHITLPFTASLLILIALIAGINFSVVPGTVGVFEFVCVLSLAYFGIAQPVALGFGILLHALAYLPMILLGLLFYWQPFWQALFPHRAPEELES